MTSTQKRGVGIPSSYRQEAKKGCDVLFPVTIKGRSILVDDIPLHMSLKIFGDKSEFELDELKDYVKDNKIFAPDPKTLRFTPIIFTAEKSGVEYYMLKIEGLASKYKALYDHYKNVGTVYKSFMAHVTIDKALYDDLKENGVEQKDIEFGPLTLEHGTGNTVHTFDEPKKSEIIGKSDYGPKKLDLYTHADNERRKQGRTGEVTHIGPNKAVRAAGPTLNDRAEQQARIDKQKSKKNPVKVYSKKERKRLAQKMGVLAASESMEKGLRSKIAGLGMAATTALSGGHAHAASGHLHQYVNHLGTLPGVHVQANFKPTKQGGMDGNGNYKIKIGQHQIIGTHLSVGGNTRHEVHMEGPDDNSADQQKAKFLTNKLKTTGNQLLERSENLEKGIKHIAAALGAVGAMAAAPTAKEVAPKQTTQQHQQSPYTSGRMLRSIARVESQNGKYTNHPASKNGESAYGKFGLMPETIRETIHMHPDLKTKHNKAMALRGDDMRRYMEDNPGLEDQIAQKHLSRLEHHFGNDVNKISMAWLNGIRGTNKAIKNKEDIANHWHVKKVRSAYEKEK